MNACVGSNGGPYDFGDYGEGFFEGAKQIVAAIKQGEWTIDLLIYPACFCYRHGIELYTKHLLKELGAYNKSSASYQKTHKLQDNWLQVVALATASKLAFFDPLEIGIAGDIIDDFCQIDSTGQVFRYPEDIKGSPHLDGLGVIYVEVLGDGIDTLFELFENWRNGLVDATT